MTYTSQTWSWTCPICGRLNRQNFPPDDHAVCSCECKHGKPQVSRTPTAARRDEIWSKRREIRR